jgi:acyl-CoA synthetase (NDP forming)
VLRTLLSPKSIAVIGASEDITKPGGRIIRNILSKGYAGELLLVNPKSRVIQGLRAYASIKELPVVPELALIAVPAQFVRPSLEELADKGTRAVVVLSAGFGEVSQEGKLEEQYLAKIADEYDMLILGPNCLGIMSYAHASKFAGILPEMVQGGIDFISGSGATVDYLAEQAVGRGLPFNSFLTVGNSAQSGVTDLLRLFDEQSEAGTARIMMLYLESINKPREFLKYARSLSKKGCFLTGIKAGTTQVGSRAAASHTGAMATNDVAVQALFDKAGIIRIHSRLELIDVANALICAKRKMDGRRVCVISDAGGPGVMLADELSRQGFEIPALSERTQTRLSEALPAGAGVSNPIDCMPTRNGAMISKVFDIILEEEVEAIDYILFVLGDSGLADNWEIYEAIIRAIDNGEIPIFPSFCTRISSHEALAKFRQAGKCFFEDEVSMARALGRVVNRPRLAEPVIDIDGYDRDRIQACLAGQRGVLSPKTARQVLEAAGLRFPNQRELIDKAELERVDIKFPWVMKVMGPIHKSDVGGVRVGIKDLEEGRAAWNELMIIEGAYGCLVQQMVEGMEVIIGAKRESEFGHLIGFGLGGIYTEALRDVQFALAPLSWEEAERMIWSTRAYPIIRGTRGERGMDLKLLKDWLIRIGLLVYYFPQIQELDLNPVRGYGGNLYVVDARILIG